MAIRLCLVKLILESSSLLQNSDSIFTGLSQLFYDFYKPLVRGLVLH